MKTPECLLAYAEELEQYYARHYPPLAPLAKPCFLSTVQTTMEPLPGGETFVITGDIPAMWLRDSSAQVKNYLPFAAKDEQVRSLLRGVIATQVKDVLIDAYANAFNREANGKGFQDKTERNPAVWERKYEVDSLCAPILLAQQYEDASGDTAIYTEAFHRMLRRIAEVFRLEQHHERSPYSFERENCPPSDTLPGGRGTPVGFTGMTWSGFRPSDDRCFYNYLIPSNMFAAVELLHLAEIFEKIAKDGRLSQKCRTLSAEIRQGIKNFGCVVHEKFGKMYAYETDGLGNYILSDDANVPSLLSAPYLGFCSKNDPVYEATRDFVLSKDNPFYFEGKYAKGVGSPHTPKNFVWHIALSMQGLTAKDKEEKLSLLKMLVSATDGTDLMHEGFDVNDPSKYTRPWFAWSCSLFCEFVMHCLDEGVI